MAITNKAKARRGNPIRADITAYQYGRSKKAELEARRINAEPWDPLPNHVKIQCRHCQFYFASLDILAECCPDCQLVTGSPQVLNRANFEMQMRSPRVQQMIAEHVAADRIAGLVGSSSSRVRAWIRSQRVKLDT